MNTKLLIAAMTALVLTACATTTEQTPEQARISRINRACALDAGIRPVVTVMMTDPDVSAEDVATIVALRAVIDPVCANPSGNAGDNVATAFAAATSQMLTTVARIQAEKNAKK